MKKLISLILVLSLLCLASAAAADPKRIDGKSKRDITIQEAGLNTEPDELIMNDESPTTGRKLSTVYAPDNFRGAAVNGQYTPMMVMISNASNGFNSEKEIARGESPYQIAPVNGQYADIVYEACQVANGSLTRMSMIFSDTIPDYVGFIRSTRYTHVRLRQEWNSLFLTSGYEPSVADEWLRCGVRHAADGNMGNDPGPVYVGGVSAGKPWRKYYVTLDGIKDANNRMYRLAALLGDKTCVREGKFQYANHSWLFTDEVPEGGDSGEIVYVTFGGSYTTDSRLEYDEDTNSYIRWVDVPSSAGLPYSSSKLLNPVLYEKDAGDWRVTAEQIQGDPITFNNVIIQSIIMKWEDGGIPDPKLVGTGNADYFMCGKHYEGVWQRNDLNSRTVYYDRNGQEIRLQRGRTLIILMNYGSADSDKFNVKYE